MTILLIFHIAISFAMTVFSMMLFGAGIVKKTQEGLRYGVIGSWVLSASSGIGLIFSGASLLHFCVTMSVFSFVALASERYYLYRVKNASFVQ